VADEERTVVLFEAPGRVAPTLGELAAACGGERAVVVAREMTKLHEEVWRGTLAEAADAFSAHPARGEVALVVEGASPPAVPSDAAVDDAVRARLDAGDSLRDAADTVATELGVARRRAYQAGVAVRRNAEA
jgi:16S rRNA (cytidine1402-2'-O)-methyltransferase